MRRRPAHPDIEVALDLVARLYEAAVEPARWPEFLDGFAGAVGGEGTIIWLQDYADASARVASPGNSFVANARWTPGFLEDYARHYTFVNVWAKSAEHHPVGATLTSDILYPDRDLPKTEYYADWLRPQGLRYALGGAVERRGSVDVHFSCLRPEKHGPFEQADLDLHRLLVPHMKRALGLHVRIARERAAHAGAVWGFDLLSAPVWVLDPAGRVVFANRAGREIDRRHDGMWIAKDGSPRAAEPGDNDALQRLIANAISSGQGQALSVVPPVAIRRRRDPAPLQVFVYPLGSQARQDGCAAALFVTDPASIPVPEGDAIRALYRLTAAETRLALAIAGGATLAEYGETAGVSLNTVKTHLRRVLMKTGARSQAGLVRLLLALAWSNPIRSER